ncbi:MAG: phosphate signaling complex protein PhoU [Hyphomicrobiaceae bacterium]|nr:phosphate signaling complex protein PhoU [Hyphomicrobiaceae bacterium]
MIQDPNAGHAHTVASFDTDLKVLDDMVADMGTRAGRALTEATRALMDRDIQLAQQVIASDRSLDLLQHELEEKAVATIARRQPMAVDLREIVSAMRIAGDLERVGDLAKNVAKRVVAIGEQPSPLNLATGLSTLSERVNQQLTAVLKAYAARNDKAALEVWRADGAIDGLFTSLFRELLTYMMEDPRSIGYCTHLLFCAKNLERVGDHATNIAETAHYVITGEALIAERPKGDESSAIEPSLRPPQT